MHFWANNIRLWKARDKDGLRPLPHPVEITPHSQQRMMTFARNVSGICFQISYYSLGPGSLDDMSMPPPAGPSMKSAKAKSPQLAQNTKMPDQHGPVAPAILAEAISKLDTLRLSRTNSQSKSPSPSTSPASGSSSPDLVQGAVNTEKMVNAIANAVAEGRTVSVPGTPHFGAQSEMYIQSSRFLSGC